MREGSRRWMRRERKVVAVAAVAAAAAAVAAVAAVAMPWTLVYIAVIPLERRNSY